MASSFAAAVGARPRLIDLACGTGSNLRYLSPRLGRDQTWLCFDHDAALLEAAAIAVAAWGGRRGLVHDRPGPTMRLRSAHANLDVSLMCRDLSDARRGFGLDGVDGLTASGFLDLVSANWLDEFVHRLKARRLPLLFALTYDGRMQWCPESEHDALVRERFHRHQRSDKGFGAALGPAAAPYLGERLERSGFRVDLARSDWHVGDGDGAMLAAFQEGVVGAAREVEDDRALAAWAALRDHQLREGALRLEVGHLDLLALPA